MQQDKWHQLSLVQQLGNIGAEIGRTISWRQNKVMGNPQEAFFRGLELLDLSINDPKNHGAGCHELCRVREALVDWYYGSKLYHTTDQSWNNYFIPFGIAANRK